MNLLCQLFFAESVQRAYLLCEDAAGNEPTAHQRRTDDQKSIWRYDGSCAKQRFEILRQLLTADRIHVLRIICIIIKQQSHHRS